MALKLSTGLRNYMLQQGSFKSAFSDSVLRIYSGSPPSYPTTSDADAAPTGTLLLEVTKSSGTVSSSELAVPQMHKAIFAGGSGNYVLRIGPSGSEVSYTIAFTGSILASMKLMCDLINRTCPEFAMAHDGTDTAYLAPRVQGNSGVVYTCDNTGTTATLTVSTTSTFSIAADDCLQFGVATSGSIVKALTWSGVGLAAAGTGTSAGYFRLVRPNDLGTLNQTDLRLQGTVGTSGTDLIMSSTTIVYNATTTVDSFTITLPVSL